MKVLYQDLRHGVMKLKTESLDDLWYLSQVIREGDVVKSKTQRRVKDRDDVKSDGGERRTVTLAIRVEKTEFKRESNALRVSGVIEEAPEDVAAAGSHHTFNLDSDSAIAVVKDRWGRTELSRIDDAVNSTLRPKVLVALIEDGEATVGFIRDSGVDYTEFSRNIGGKYDMKGRSDRLNEFHGELAALLRNLFDKNNISLIILAGPGFGKSNFLKFLGEKDAALAVKCVLEDTGSGGRNGVQEVLKREVMHKALEDVNLARDARLVEEVLRHVGSGSGLAAYGFGEVCSAVKSNAVQALLVSDRIFFGDRGRVEPLMVAVKNARGLFHIVNHDSDAGRQLESLGGLAAVLRYRIS